MHDGTALRLTETIGRISPDDRELVDPPADLWDRIAAAIAAEEAEAPAIGAGSVVEYRIDAWDRMVGVGEGWAAFAEHNEAPELVKGAEGRTLWDVMGDDLADLWRPVVDRVRAEQVELVVPFRCDGPDARRWYDMTVSPGPDGVVRFRSVLTMEMARPDLPALRRPAELGLAPERAAHDHAAVELCCWCAEARDGERWVMVEELLSSRRLLEVPRPPAVAHGICERCQLTMAELAEPARA
ncbi:MAG: hypothetical protein ACOYOP_13515 [Microthrixaceae bacterium]